MALTFTVTDLKGYSLGNKRGRDATITVSGTTTDNGDALVPSALGLSSISSLNFNGGTGIDSTSNPEAGFIPKWIRATGKIVFLSQAVAGATTAPAVITDGTTVADVLEVTAIGI